MSSCEKRVYRRMCEHPDGTRTGRYKKNEYYSVPKDAKKRASGTKKTSKPTKNTKPKVKSVRKPVIDYEQVYDDHLDYIELDRNLEKDHDLWMQKQYLKEQFSKRQASKRKKYSKPKNYEKEAYDIIMESIDRAAKIDFKRVLNGAEAKAKADNSKYMIHVDSKGKATRVMKPIVTYQVFYMKNPTDFGRYVRKKARSLEELRSSILSSGTLGKAYNKSVWIYTEDGKWTGRMRAAADGVEWTSNEKWTNIKHVDKFGNVIA